MVRIAFTLTLLSLLFAFTYARTPSGILENEVVDLDPENSVKESHVKPTLFLPIQKTLSETNSIKEMAPEAVEAKPIDVEDSVGITEDLKAETETQTLDLKRPLMIVKFRPVNRHIGRGCHYWIKKKMMNPWIRRSEKSYGNDIILGGQKKEFDQETFGRGGMRQRWMKFYHHHHHDHDQHHDHKRMRFFSFRHHDHYRFSEHSFRKPFHPEESENREDEGREQRKEGGFLNRFNKFFDDLF